jgi:hypothetical protein
VAVQEDYVDDCFHAEGVDRLTGGDPESGFRLDQLFSEETFAAGLACASDRYTGGNISATVFIENRIGDPRRFGLFCHEQSRRVLELSGKGWLAGAKVSEILIATHP